MSRDPAIAICTDSAAQVPAELVERHDLTVVPLSVTIDGVVHREGVDLDADGFWSRFGDDGAPEVTTAAPAPGEFARTYADLAAAGASEVLSIHTGSETSGTFNAARVGAEASPIPVELVDSGVSSFSVGLAVLAAVEALDDGASVPEAVAEATATAASTANVFVVGALDLARQGGRLVAGATEPIDGIPILAMIGGTMEVVGHVATLEDAAERMADTVLADTDRLRVGLARADEGSWPLADALRGRLEERAVEIEVIEYRVGPSVGAHTGPGTAGAVYHPLG